MKKENNENQTNKVSSNGVQLLTRQETANILRVCLKTLDTLIANGEIRAVKPTASRAVRVLRSDLEEFIRGCSGNNHMEVAK